jgi:hypothetical protein
MKRPAKSETVSDLDIPLRGLYLLAAPSTPAPARQEIIERAGQGEKLTAADLVDANQPTNRRHHDGRARSTARASSRSASDANALIA